MEDLLTPISTRHVNDKNIGLAESTQIPDDSVKSKPSINPSIKPNEVLEVLRSKPDEKTLSELLLILSTPVRSSGSFQIHDSSAEAAQIINELVNNTIPDFWRPFFVVSKNGKSRFGKDGQRLLRCLTSVTGLGAMLSRIRTLLLLSEDKKPVISSSNIALILSDLLEVLSFTLLDSEFLPLMFANLKDHSTNPARFTILLRETISIICSSKLLSTASEAQSILKKSHDTVGHDYWVTSGEKYASWLGKRITAFAMGLDQTAEKIFSALAQMLGKSLSLGYTDDITKVFYQKLLLDQAEAPWSRFHAIFDKLQRHEQRTVLQSILRTVSNRYFPTDSVSTNDASQHGELENLVAATAGVIQEVVKNNKFLQDELVLWLTSSSGGGIGEGIGIRRAVVAVLAQDTGLSPSFQHITRSINKVVDEIQALLEKCMNQFGDKLYIKHAPMMHQEVNAQTLLLAAGYVHRSYPMFLFTLARSSTHLNGVSNSLSASSERSRFIGMIIGTALSKLVDKEDKRMNFGLEEIESPEGKWYQDLVQVQDRVGKIKDLKDNKIPRRREVEEPYKPLRGTRSDAGGSKIIKIEEIEESQDSEDSEEEFVSYEKPDSDEEDEDEDATLIQRNKPTAPVYIRDLVLGLQESDNYEQQRLALTNAASLIRRKTGFGTEVADHAQDLAAQLTGLHDKYEMEDFQKFRLQGMIAVLVALPSKMGPWFAKTFFNGDYSTSQRASILTTLGMAARELGGYKEQDSRLTGAKAVDFPTKMLPEKLHNLYSGQINQLAKQLEDTMMQPMALEAADKSTGPDVLKVRTFSSRMEVEKTRKRPIANELAKIVAESFFFPITGRWWINLQAYGSKNIHFEPFLLTTFIRTLALILHASGTNTLDLPQMTSEFWDLLLSLRSNSSNDSSVQEAILFALLTLLDVNEDKRLLVNRHAKELLETQDWVQAVFDSIAGGDKEGNKIKMLAAGVLLRCKEVVDKYQRLLVGDMVGY